jgi:DNA-binding transcriptional ArsR family regulator
VVRPRGEYILLEEYVLWRILLVVDLALLAALAEPNRLRIVELLGKSPRPVGEIATRLDLRQPQVTKHLQTLERTGLVEVHPLGRRRIYALRRERLRELSDWLSGLKATHPSENALVKYRAAIEAEQALSEQQRRTPRTFSSNASCPRHDRGSGGRGRPQRSCAAGGVLSISMLPTARSTRFLAVDSASSSSRTMRSPP